MKKPVSSEKRLQWQENFRKAVKVLFLSIAGAEKIISQFLNIIIGIPG